MNAAPVTLSPLAEIERSVQARAKDRNLDVAGGDGTGLLRQLIDAEISAWSEQYKRGLRPYDLSDADLWPIGPSATWPATGRSPPSWPTTTCGR